jgi:type II secretion system protein G
VNRSARKESDMSEVCNEKATGAQHGSPARSYPGLDFKFNINDLPRQYVDRLSKCITSCERITSLLERHRISKRPMLHLSLWSDPISPIWLDRNADKALKEKYRETKVHNVTAIYNQIAARADAGEKIPITIDETFKWHQRLLLNIPQNASMPSGQFRKSSMRIGDMSIGTCCKDVPVFMELLFYWLDGPAFESKKGSHVGHAFIKAIVAHMYFVSIHPFYDGNGSLARFLQYSILRNAGVPAQIAHLLGNYYNENREGYMIHMNAARSSGDVMIFLNFALNGLSLKLNAYLDELLKDFPETLYAQVKEEKFAFAKGFTILEILVVLAVLAILIGMAVPRIKGMQDQAGITRAKSEVRAIQAALESYKINNGSYLPIREDAGWGRGMGQLSDLLSGSGPQLISTENLKDPWGNDYMIFAPNNDPQYYVIYSSGPSNPNFGSRCNLEVDVPATTTALKHNTGCQCVFATNAPLTSMVIREY